MAWSFKHKLLVFFVLLFPLLISLGFWQLSRYEEKKALQQQFEQYLDEPPAPLNQVMRTDEPRYRRITVSGFYENAHSFLLDNRVFQGQSGYEVFTPFRMLEGRFILVNRGWLARGADRSVLPAIPSHFGQVTLEGMLYSPLGKAFVLGSDPWDDLWPKRIQSLDFPRIENLLEQPVSEYFLVLDREQSGSLTYTFKPVVMSPAKHMGYAVQWFLMAACLLVLVTYRLTANKEKQVREQQ